MSKVWWGRVTPRAANRAARPGAMDVPAPGPTGETKYADSINELVRPLMESGDLYRVMCDYLTKNGWEREEAHSGWWIPDFDVSGEFEEAPIGDAVEQQLLADGIEMREPPTEAGPGDGR